MSEAENRDSKADIAMIEFVQAGQNRDEDFRKKNSRLVRKLDLYIAPVMMLLMLISYLDRGNIGFAATQGMADDIGLHGTQLNFPVSLLVKRLQFNRVIPAATVAWGLVCMCNGFINNFAGLCVCRLILGLFEGCLFPSLTLFMANWYLREELAIRISYLMIASALAGAFGGLIAFGILYMDVCASLTEKPRLYILEGLATIVIGCVCIYLVPKDPETAYFLNAEEKALMRYRAEQSKDYSGGEGHYKMADVKLATKDIKTWVHAITQICVVTILYGRSDNGSIAGFGTFLPIILKNGFHYSTKQAQYLTIPVNLWGALVYAIGAVLADKYNVRYLMIFVCIPFGIAGYAILLAFDVPVGVLYLGTFLIATPCFLSNGSNIAWLSSNCAPDGKRAASLGIQLTLTNLGGIVAGQIYQSNSAPRFVLGHSWSLGSLVVAFIGCTFLRIVYHRRENWKAQARENLEQGRSSGVPELWGPTDRGLNFKYLI
ncbi:hypothetical protein N7457_007865 [Penicillium paradoxum]|uniref:uncharacterized protein n=1 Tax=Penicillium paradoxum TaxID=176176 RepID=UPI0025499464|nr:uncharacterized protein N7457_007865 [Penicillium paradoxum]KAJ5772969.1 hypothetical protein N7457_007865 [Penicillium paradoxum]